MGVSKGDGATGSAGSGSSMLSTPSSICIWTTCAVRCISAARHRLASIRAWGSGPSWMNTDGSAGMVRGRAMSGRGEGGAS